MRVWTKVVVILLILWTGYNTYTTWNFKNRMIELRDILQKEDDQKLSSDSKVDELTRELRLLDQKVSDFKVRDSSGYTVKDLEFLMKAEKRRDYLLKEVDTELRKKSEVTSDRRKLVDELTDRGL